MPNSADAGQQQVTIEQSDLEETWAMEDMERGAKMAYGLGPQVTVAHGGPAINDAGSHYGDVTFGQPRQRTATDDAMLDVMLSQMQSPSAAASNRITLDDFGNPVYIGITRDQLTKIMPNAGKNVDLYLEPLNSAMEQYGIKTLSQQAAFLAQVGIESGELRRTEENLNYSARRLTEVWPARFPNEAIAAPYANSPEALGNLVYSNRLGNGNEASGDGFRYRGGGLMQITGRENYRAAGFENNPEALREPVNAANSAAQFWIDKGLNERTSATLNRTQFNGITSTVNGGQHGSATRWQLYQRALQALEC